MKNLLGKIVKPLLIPALALSMNLKNADAQKLEFHPGIYGGVGTTKYSKFEMYSNWEQHFKGLDGDEELKHKKIKAYGDFQVGVDLGISFNNFSFGLNSRYSISEVFKERALSAVELHNWHFDYATVYEATLKQKTPSLGAYVKFPVWEDTEMVLRGSARKSEINEIKREDVYFAPDSDSKCPPTPSDDTDGITREFERARTKTLLNRIGLELQSPEDEGMWGLELYYETDWKRVHAFGANVNLHFILPEKKDNKNK
jgi:hypothetical protein